MARTIHRMAVDSIHDELVVPNPFAQAILFFRGAANGEEEPIRIIQGPKTMLDYVDNVEVDPVHNEVFTADSGTNAVLAFRRDASGDVAPLRIIHGPKTRLDGPDNPRIDPLNDLLMVSNRDPSGILIFKRTDHGNVAPQAILLDEDLSGRFEVYPEGKRIFAARKGTQMDTGIRDGFVGVWKYELDGTVELWAKIPASVRTKLVRPSRIALNPDDHELYVDVGGHPSGVAVFYVPELFSENR